MDVITPIKVYINSLRVIGNALRVRVESVLTAHPLDVLVSMQLQGE